MSIVADFQEKLRNGETPERAEGWARAILLRKLGWTDYRAFEPGILDVLDRAAREVRKEMGEGPDPTPPAA